MSQPQSDEEIRPIIEALRRLVDPLIDIRWNPTEIIVDRGTINAIGQVVNRRYDGRWQVVKNDPSIRLREDRDYAVICTVTEVDALGRFVHQGAYRPIGWWLVEHMQRWDSKNAAQLAEQMKAVWDEHDAVEAAIDTNERAANQEALEKIYREHGGEYWMGRGFGDGVRTTK